MADPSMKLPDGKTCADCANFSKCGWLVGVKGPETVCDFAPSRFIDAAELLQRITKE